MKTTLLLDDRLVVEARRQTGATAKTAVVRLGLEALIQRESACRLASLKGAMSALKSALRRRSLRKSA